MLLSFEDLKLLVDAVIYLDHDIADPDGNRPWLHWPDGEGEEQYMDRLGTLYESLATEMLELAPDREALQ